MNLKGVVYIRYISGGGGGGGGGGGVQAKNHKMEKPNFLIY